MMYPPRKAPTTVRPTPGPPHPPPVLMLAQKEREGSQVEPSSQAVGSWSGVQGKSGPRTSQLGLRRKNGSGTSNQKSLEANKNNLAKLKTFKLKLSQTKISLKELFFFLAVPNSASNPQIAKGKASTINPIMNPKANS
mmetsp:Transcript_16275/g.34173  ORF Transcript_16275/g.34173 Transcript_16275/m.34173 type:complete len:138 (-) Transcript_16275:518-931(-)